MFYCICRFGFSSYLFVYLCIDHFYSFIFNSSMVFQSVDSQVIKKDPSDGHSDCVHIFNILHNCISNHCRRKKHMLG